MESVALGVGEVVTLVVCDEIDNGTLGECGRLVDNEPTLLNANSERAHVTTVGRPVGPGKVQPAKCLKPVL